MRVFLDTNILLDVIEQREPHVAASQAVFDRCDALGLDLSIAAHSLVTIFYITKKRSGNAAAMEVIHQILSWAEVAPLGDYEARKALGYGNRDYEDALQAAAAESASAHWLVTRDPKGFVNCPLPVVSPDEFLTRLRP